MQAKLTSVVFLFFCEGFLAFKSCHSSVTVIPQKMGILMMCLTGYETFLQLSWATLI